MDIFQIDSFIFILLYNIDIEKVIIGYSYLVLGTPSAGKFDKVPSTSLDIVAALKV